MRAFPRVVIGCLLTWSVADLPAQADPTSAGGGGTTISVSNSASLLLYSDLSTGLLSINGSGYTPYSGGSIPGVSSVTIYTGTTGSTMQTIGTVQKTGTSDIFFNSISPSGGILTVGSGLTFTSGGSLTVNNGSSLILDGSLTLSGSTFNSGTNLITGLNTVLGSGVSAILAPNSTIGANGVLTLNSGSVINTTGVTVNGTATLNEGVVNLGAGFSFTKTSGGTLSLGTNSGASTVNVIGGSGLTISSGLNFGGSISGTGGIVKTGTGTLNFGSGLASSGGVTLVNSGTLSLNNGGNTGTGAIAVNGGTLTVNGGTIATGATNVTGGTLILSGSNTYTGITAVNLTGNNTSSGAITTTASGTLTLNASNTVFAGTTVSGATLTVSNTNTTANLLTSGSNLTINRATAFDFTSGIPKTGQITLAGAMPLNFSTAAGAQLSNLGPVKDGAAGSVGTTFKFLDGVLSNSGTVSILYLPAAQNLANDPLSLHFSEFNTPGVHDKYVLEMSYDPTKAATLGDLSKLYLAWFDPSDSAWKNAVLGNSDGGVSSQLISGAYDPTTDFVLGDYGIDTTNNMVWAVVDHDGTFGAAIPDTAPANSAPQSLLLTPSSVPEPSSAALLLCGAALFDRRSRKKK